MQEYIVWFFDMKCKSIKFILLCIFSLACGSVDKAVIDSFQSYQDSFYRYVVDDPNDILVNFSIDVEFSQAVRQMYSKTENVILKGAKKADFFKSPNSFFAFHVRTLLDNDDFLQGAPKDWNNIFQLDFVRHMILIKSIRNMRVGRSVDEDDESFKNKIQETSQELLQLAEFKGFEKRLFLFAHVETLLRNCKRFGTTGIDEEGVIFAKYSLISLCENNCDVMTDKQVESFLRGVFALYKKSYWFDYEKVMEIGRLLTECGCDESIFADNQASDVDGLNSKKDNYIFSDDEDTLDDNKYDNDIESDGLIDDDQSGQDDSKQEIQKRSPILRLFVGGCVLVGVPLIFIGLLYKMYWRVK